MATRVNNSPPIVCFVGNTGSGKTSIIEKTVQVLTERGYRIGVVKHHVHGGFEVDKPGKDTWRIARAGARAVALVSPNKMFVVQETKAEITLSEVAGMMADIDLILTEGFRSEAYAKILVVGNEVDSELPSVTEDVVTVVSDSTVEFGIDSIKPNDHATLCNLIEKRFLRQ